MGGQCPAWFVRITEHDYCREEDSSQAREAVNLYSERPGREHYESVDQLLALPRERFNALSVWNRCYPFALRMDATRPGKKYFLVSSVLTIDTGTDTSGKKTGEISS